MYKHSLYANSVETIFSSCALLVYILNLLKRPRRASNQKPEFFVHSRLRNILHLGRRHSFRLLRRISALALTFGFLSFALDITFLNNRLEARANI